MPTSCARSWWSSLYSKCLLDAGPLRSLLICRECLHSKVLAFCCSRLNAKCLACRKYYLEVNRFLQADGPQTLTWFYQQVRRRVIAGCCWIAGRRVPKGEPNLLQALPD